jgi:Leucine-rich repeat (LRR) protein
VPAIAAFVAKCPSLRRLDLSLNPLGSSCMPVEQISDNSIDFCPLAPLLDAFAYPAAQEGFMSHMEALDLSCIGSWHQCRSRNSVMWFEQFIQTLQVTHQSLRQLHLRSIELKDDHAAAIADSLVSMHSLEELTLSGNEISDTGAARLAFVLDRVTSLRSLDLASNQVRCSPRCSLSSKSRLTGSTVLLARQITRKGLAVFQRMLRQLREPFALRHLFLERNVDIPPRDLVRLHELMHAKVLETHLLSDAGVSSADDNHDAAVLTLDGKVAARSLAIGGCLIDRHIRVVVDVLRTAQKWQALRELDLSGNRVGATGAAAIALYLALHPSLRVLNLSANAMDGTMRAVITIVHRMELD